MTDKIELNFSSFLSWLEAKGESFAGYPNDPCNCPVANWAKEISEQESYVTRTQLQLGNRRYLGSIKRLSLPAEFAAFIAALDERFAIDRAVTGEEALEMWES